MFKHELSLESTLEEVEVNIVIVDEPSECSNDDEEIIDLDNVNYNSTFINPSQDDKNSKEELFKCDKCDFASARKDDINDHKESYHNWCSTCLSSFVFQESLKKHIKKEHSEKRRLK